MQNANVDDVDPGSVEFSVLCTHLNALQRREGAACAPDLFSGGYKFSDEVPPDIDALGSNLMPLVNLLRCLWGYRASLVTGNVRQDLAPYWNAARASAPLWAGFSPERSAAEMKTYIDDTDRLATEFVAEMERMDRNLRKRASSLAKS
ncbi:MAG TPA: hypothetical protein VFE47_14400 [Tepidisphaeraceae bacterium]|jgi:hypothetical protein|nr:hypothetical protein [Tepidisphaeraceae bacterium]